jgi:hypothetical protein
MSGSIAAHARRILGWRTPVSAVLDPVRFLFINVDLTLALQCDPAGNGCSSTRPRPSATGTGLAETIVSDTGGPCGLALQTLLIAPR